MYSIEVETGFFGYHRVAEPGGGVEPLHSHNWEVKVQVGSEKLNEGGMVMDFVKLKGMVDNITARISEKRMGEVEFFRENGASTENVARYIYDNLVDKLPKGVSLEAVWVRESAGCRAKYSR